MAKASKMFTYGGKGTTQKPQYGKEAARQIIRQCREAGGKTGDSIRIFRAVSEGMADVRTNKHGAKR
jgi:hypothetical protein